MKRRFAQPMDIGIMIMMNFLKAMGSNSESPKERINLLIVEIYVIISGFQDRLGFGTFFARSGWVARGSTSLISYPFSITTAESSA